MLHSHEFTGSVQEGISFLALRSGQFLELWGGATASWKIRFQSLGMDCLEQRPREPTQISAGTRLQLSLFWYQSSPEEETASEESNLG